MTVAEEKTERRKLLAVRREYEKEGYRVVVEPSGDDLPQFLAGLQPDMIAYRDGEAAVIEVRLRETLSAAPRLTDLAHAVQAMPGWRLDLAVRNPRYQPLVEGPATELTLPDIEERFRTVRQLVQSGQTEAGLLLAWTATEAALRHIATREAVRLEQYEPSYVIHALRVYGVLSEEEFDTLRVALQVRNTVTHGFHQDTDIGRTVGTLIGTTRALLEHTSAK